MTEEEERQLLREKIATYTDLDFSRETLEQLRWLVDRYDRAARLFAEKGRMAAMSYGEPRQEAPAPEADREK